MLLTEIQSALKAILRKIKILFLTVGALLLLVLIFIPQGLDFSAKAYDWTSQQQPIQAVPEIDAVLSGFEKIPFNQLEDKKYLEWSQFNEAKFSKMAKGRNFYKIAGADYPKFLVGKFRVRDFMPKDANHYTKSILPGKAQYLMIDERLLYKLAELQKTLEKEGFDSEAFDLVSCFRYPKYNKKIGGASKSRHILGEAIDIRIGDINKDGKYTQKDKQLVYDLLDKKIIGSQGGLGRYPGTRTIHFDVRGHRARWDSH